MRRPPQAPGSGVAGAQAGSRRAHASSHSPCIWKRRWVKRRRAWRTSRRSSKTCRLKLAGPKRNLEFAQTDYEGKQSSEGAIAGRVIKKRRAVGHGTSHGRGTAQSRRVARQAASGSPQRRDALQTQLKLLADETQAKDEAEAKLKLLRPESSRPESPRRSEVAARSDDGSCADRRPRLSTGGLSRHDAPAAWGRANADGSTVVTLYRPEMLQVRVDVRFEDIPKVSLGQPVGSRIRRCRSRCPARCCSSARKPTFRRTRCR